MYSYYFTLFLLYFIIIFSHKQYTKSKGKYENIISLRLYCDRIIEYIYVFIFTYLINIITVSRAMPLFVFFSLWCHITVYKQMIFIK